MILKLEFYENIIAKRGGKYGAESYTGTKS